MEVDGIVFAPENKTRNGERASMVTRLTRNLTALAIGILATGLVVACTNDGERQAQRTAELETVVQQLEQRVQELEGQLETEVAEPTEQGVTRRPALQITPAIMRYPKNRSPGAGQVWFNGSGLKPGQFFELTFTDAVSDEARFKRQRLVLYDGADILLQANNAGAFAGTLAELRPGDHTPGMRAETQQEGGVVTVEVRDTDTGEVLASAPWVICGQTRENYWCPGADDPLPAEAPEAPEDLFFRMAEELGLLGGAVGYRGIVYELDRFQVEDNLFQLRIGSEPHWGYAAEERIDATAGDGIVMTINLGDTLKFSRLGTSSRRTTKDHRLAITELGIDIEVGPGVRIEPWELKPEKAGEFVIDDPTDPGAHGKVLLIVNEPPDGSG